MKKVILALFALVTALVIAPVASAQNYDFTYTDASAGISAFGVLDVSGTTAISGTITYDSVTYALLPGSATPPAYITSPSGAIQFDNQVYPSAGPNGLLSTTGGLDFANATNTEDINIWAGAFDGSNWGGSSGPGPYNFWVWTSGVYRPTSDAGTFALTQVPEYGALSMLILSALTLAGGFFFKARQSGSLLAT
jgi:hypothetical protein